jgi:hypothetical protein
VLRLQGIKSRRLDALHTTCLEIVNQMRTNHGLLLYSQQRDGWIAYLCVYQETDHMITSMWKRFRGQSLRY